MQRLLPPPSEQGIAWNDPELAIAWPELAGGAKPQLSAKDQANPPLVQKDRELLPGPA